MMEEKLPEGWMQRKVSDFMSEVLDKVDPTDIEETIYIGLEHIGSSGGVISFGSSKEVKSLKTVFKKGDVLYGKLRPYLDKHDVAKHDGICSTDILVFRNPNEDSSKYFNYYLGLNSTISRAHEDSSGINLPRISSKKLGDFIIPLPPLPEQQRIVARLDALFGHLGSLKEKLDRIPKLLKNFRQQVLAQAVTGELTREWREGESRINYKESIPIPQSWSFHPLKELCLNLKYGSSSKSLNSGKTPVLRMGNIQDGEIDWSDLKYSSDVGEIKKYKLTPGDLLFNRTNSPELVGKTAIYRGQKDAIYAGYLIQIKPKELVNSEFLNFVLNSNFAKKWCWEVKTDGVSQSNINAKKLGDFLVPFPSIDEQEEIVKKVNALFEVSKIIESLYQSLKAKIDQLPQAILTKAFRGELVEQEVKEYVGEAGGGVDSGGQG